MPVRRKHTIRYASDVAKQLTSAEVAVEFRRINKRVAESRLPCGCINLRVREDGWGWGYSYETAGWVMYKPAWALYRDDGRRCPCYINKKERYAP